MHYYTTSLYIQYNAVEAKCVSLIAIVSVGFSIKTLRSVHRMINQSLNWANGYQGSGNFTGCTTQRNLLLAITQFINHNIYLNHYSLDSTLRRSPL